MVEKGQLCKVVFLDHCTFEDQWPGEVKPLTCVCYGMLAYETEDYIVLLSSHSLEDGSNLHNSGFVVLKAAIREIKALKEEEA